MSIKPALMPFVTQLLSSRKVRALKHCVGGLTRTLSGKSPTIYVFLKADDPYSWVLLRELPQLQQRFPVSWSLHMVHTFENDMFPAPELLAHYSAQDAQYLAALYNQPKVELPTLSAQQWQTLAIACQQNWFKTQSFKSVAELLYTSRCTPIEKTADESDLTLLRQNEKLRNQLGHYNSAMLFFENEWYWSLDRLAHLESRLNAMQLNISAPEIRFNKTRTLQFSHGSIASKDPLILYWSARSPYSYLALLRCVELSHHYQIPLEVKPVMPMMMRNMPVPNNKKMYIFLDTKREAEQQNIPYGKVADPLGEGVLRCYALLDFARQHHRYIPYLLSFAKNVNAKGVRAETDKGMETIVVEAGLDWQQAKPLLNIRHFQQEVDNNLQELAQAGLWGVPCIRYQNTIVWGQDRLARIEQAILNGQESGK